MLIRRSVRGDLERISKEEGDEQSDYQDHDRKVDPPVPCEHLRPVEREDWEHVEEA